MAAGAYCRLNVYLVSDENGIRQSTENEAGVLARGLAYLIDYNCYYREFLLFQLIPRGLVDLPEKQLVGLVFLVANAQFILCILGGVS